MARNGSLTLIAELPILQNLVEDEVIKFVNKWRNHFGRQTASGYPIDFQAECYCSKLACAAQDFLPLRTFLAASLRRDQNWLKHAEVPC